MLTHLYVVRHGETAWSLSGQHTSHSEILLTPKGEADARTLPERLRPVRFSEVLTSPRMRARRTCELAGFGSRCTIDQDIAEWNYGDCEGLRSSEIHASRPNWNIFRDGCPNGETPVEISARADRVIKRLRAKEGKAVVFTHGHFGRVLAARWLGAPLEEGSRLVLSPASVSTLSYEHDNPTAPVISLWNDAR